MKYKMAEITVLEKGSPINIEEKSPGLKNLYIGMGWDVNTSGGGDFDLDVSAAFCDTNKKLTDKKWLNYYSNLKIEEGGQTLVQHSSDDLTGGSSAEGDDEFINIHLDKLPELIQHIFIFVNIYEAKGRNQHFGMVNNSFVRLMDGDTEKEFAKYDLKAEYADKSAVMVAEIYRMGGEWKAKIIGEGVDGTIGEVLKAYGLE